MAYNKKYAELGESVIDYVNDREDMIEGAFEDFKRKIVRGGGRFTPDTSIDGGFYRVMEDITFDSPMPTSPTVVVNAHTQDPHLVFASAVSVNRYGFTLTYVRPNQSEGYVSWVAISV